MKSYLRNPLTAWMKWLYYKLKLEKQFKDKHLDIGYMSLLLDVRPSMYNTVYENVSLRNVSMGDFTYISKDSDIMNTNLGKFCSVGSNCRIGLGIHPTDLVSTHPMFFSTGKQAQITLTDESEIEEYKEIIVGHDVWIGTNSIILDGVTIANGAIVAAGAVVTKNVPSYAIVAGAPAKVIRYRFTLEQIDQLQASKWWNKDIQWLKEHQKEMLDVELFLKALK